MYVHLLGKTAPKASLQLLNFSEAEEKTDEPGKTAEETGLNRTLLNLNMNRTSYIFTLENPTFAQRTFAISIRCIQVVSS